MKCLGNGLELFSASTVFPVCQVIAFVKNTSVIEVNRVVVLPRLVCNI